MGHGFKLMAAIALISTSSQANVIATTGQIQLISPPPSASLASLVSDAVIFGFRERQNVLLPSDLWVDAQSPGLYSFEYQPGSNGVYVPKGTRVESFMFHSNSTPNVPGGAADYVGTATFDSIILGVIFTRAGLDGTDSLLGFPSTQYPSDGDVSFRELETPGFGGSFSSCGHDAIDCFAIGENRRTLNLYFSTAEYIDEVRVLIARLPEPGTLALLGLGLAGLGLSRRRKAN